MAKDNKSDGVADAAEVGLVVTGAAIGGPVGAGLGVAAVLAAKVPKALRRGKEARLARFINQVVHYLEANDPEGAAEFVALHSETDTFADTLDRGYEAMRRTFDPAAEECICLLTADHARLGKPTDRRFVRAAALLEICDLSMLQTLNSITTAYLSALGEAGHGVLRILFDRHAHPEMPASFFIEAYDGPTLVGTSEEVPRPDNLERALSHLVQYDYGLSWWGGGTLPRGNRHSRGATPSSVHKFKNSDDESMRSLHRYLAPVRRGTT